MLKVLSCALVLAAATASAQQNWEVGGLGGFATAPTLTVQNATASGKTGLANGVAVGAFGGQDMYRYWSGEVSYLYRQSDLRLYGQGRSVTFDGHTHLITGDFLAHFTPKGSRIRPYVSVGGGIEILQGTGQESAFQPLGNLAALTATREVLPVGDVGVGVKVQLSPRLRLRIQARDYISKAPNDVISPAPGTNINGIMHDLVGTVGLSVTW